MGVGWGDDGVVFLISVFFYASINHVGGNVPHGHPHASGAI